MGRLQKSQTMLLLFTSCDTKFLNKGCWLSSGQSGTSDLSSISYRVWLSNRASSLPHTQGGSLGGSVAIVELDLAMMSGGNSLCSTAALTADPIRRTSADSNLSGSLHDTARIPGQESPYSSNNRLWAGRACSSNRATA